MKILLIKLGAMGDVLRTTSILPGLIEKYPNAQIVWFTKQNAVYLLENNPFISKVYYYSSDQIRKLKKNSFDLVINLDEDFEACALATEVAQSKKDIRGFYIDADQNIVSTPSARTWFNMGMLGKKPENNILKAQNTKTYQEHMFDIIGIRPNNYDTYLRLTTEQEQIAKNFARRYRISTNDFLIGINTGAGGRWPQKKWSVKKTAKLIDRLHKELDAKILLFGGPEEIERNNQILSLTNVPVIDTGTGNNLKEFPAVMSLCHLVVTSDSLGMHIALALKKKVVVLFGPTSHHEIELYGLGEKVYPAMGCLVCYKKYECEKSPNCMDNITVDMVFDKVKSLTKKSVSVVITAFKEPKTIGKAIQSFIDQDILKSHNLDYHITVASPDEPTKVVIKEYEKKYPGIVEYFHDPGKGKSYALNLLFPKLKGDILIFSDGDVHVSKDAVRHIMAEFWRTNVGCVTGRVVSASPRNTMLGYWSHLLADAGAHHIRLESAQKGDFLECSGYLFAFRNGIIDSIPLDVAEDAYIPYIFWNKGYHIGYASKACVFVKNPHTFEDWLKQRVRTAKAHETLGKYVDIKRTKRVKSFSNELRKGFFMALSYPRNLKELFWTFTLFTARLYMWMRVFIDTRIISKHYNDGWDRIETTK